MAIHNVEKLFNIGDKVRHPQRRSIGTITSIEWYWIESEQSPGRAIYTILFPPVKEFGGYTRRYCTDAEFQKVEEV